MATKKSIAINEASIPHEVIWPRQDLLNEALHITSNDRNSAYGSPEDNFQNIADYWTKYLTTLKGGDIVVSSQDVAHMMILMKIARLNTNPNHRDSLVDIAGYAACGEDCRMRILNDCNNGAAIHGASVQTPYSAAGQASVNVQK